MFELEPIDNTLDEPIIKVIGVGGGGGNAVDHMVKEQIEGVEFYAANTDTQALRRINVTQKIQIGTAVTKGLGAGANPEVGKNAAQEDREAIRNALEGADMVFIAAGMGGGTGTGAAPVVAEIAKELEILTVAVITKPFSFEGKKRMAFAEQGISKLAEHVDSLIIIPNDKLLKVLGRGVSLLNAFSAANGVLMGAVQGIADLITKDGLVNVDFADVRTVMSEMGYAMMGSGKATGDNRAEEAAEMAISSPLLEDIDLSGARGVLVNVTAGLNFTLDEFDIVGNTVQAFASDNATVVIGTTIDPDMNDEIRVTVVATGIGMDKRPETLKPTNLKDKPDILDPTIFINKKIESSTSFKEKVENDNSLSNEASHDPIITIPAFLRKQAD